MTPLRADPDYRRSLRDCLDGPHRRPYYRRMSYGLLYYILLLFWLVFGIWWGWDAGYRAFGPNILLFVLFLLIGMKLFGPPIHG